MIFETKIQGIPCKCQVLWITKGMSAVLYGSGAGDIHPPELPEFEFRVLDRKGYKAPWLERKMTEADNERLQEEFFLEKALEEYEYWH